jgi:hypothetical protein
VDTERFKELNNRFGHSEVELFASKTNNLLPSHYTKENDCYSTEWMRLALYGNPKYASDDLYRALDKAASEFKNAPETTKFMFVLPKMENSKLVQIFHSILRNRGRISQRNTTCVCDTTQKSFCQRTNRFST